MILNLPRILQAFVGLFKPLFPKSVQERFTELANHFSFEHEFEELYKSREDGSFAYGFDEMLLPTGNSTSSIVTTSTTNSGSTACVKHPHCKKRSNDRTTCWVCMMPGPIRMLYMLAWSLIPGRPGPDPDGRARSHL